jgi:hypothetical protein
MPTQTARRQSKPSGEVWLSSAEVRAWMGLSHEELDALVARGTLTARSMWKGLKPVFAASEVAALAERSRAPGQG